MACNTLGSKYTKKWLASLSPEKREAHRARGRILVRKSYQRNKNSPRFGFRSYRNAAKRRGVCWEITKEEFMSLWQKPCHYCGDAIETIGIDRIDNPVGYVFSNCVPCCRFCNAGKNNLSCREFIERSHRIASRHNKVLTITQS